MTHPNPGNQGGQTTEQQKHMLERKDDVPKTTDVIIGDGAEVPTTKTAKHPEARASEFSVSRTGMNQESRQHNKHNNPGQSGHKPQKHGPAEEKQ